MPSDGETHGRSLSLRISIRLAIAALLLSLLEVVVVLVMYGSNRPKLAEQLITLQAERIGRIVREAPDLQATRDRLARIERPSGADAWNFAVHDQDQRLIYERRSPAQFPQATWPAPTVFDWTHRESPDHGELMYGGRRLTGSDFDVRVTIGVRGNGLRLFAPVFVREAIDHVALPVIPLTLVLLLVNVQIVRKMLAPLATAAAQVDALNPAHMEARLQVPASAHEVRALVLAVNRALDRLQHAMMVLESFTADAAHEMRTPLSILKLRIDSLEPGPLKDRLREDLAAMTRLVDQMLDLAQADVLDIKPGSKVVLSELARDVAARMHPVAFARGCDIRLVDRGGDCVAGHPEALARVLSNLIDNAIAHSPAETAVDVIVGPGAHIVVRDHGPGISAENTPFLFKRFWRGPAQAHDGAGLGLAIAHSILTKHGATITAGNAEDGGAIFTIDWPREIPA